MKIAAFDGLTLVDYEIDDDIPLEFVSAARTLPGQAGAYDAFGNDQVRAPLAITRSFWIVGSSFADVDDQLDAIRAKANLGLRWLTIEMRDGTIRGTWAKLTRVQAPYDSGLIEHLPVQLSFFVPWPWLEDEDQIWRLDTGEVLDDGLTFDGNYTTRTGAGAMTITNTGGDAITKGMILIKGSATNPTITNEANGYSLSYGASIAAGSTLYIDFGAQSVIEAGVSGWPNLALGDDQIDLFRIEVGANLIRLTGGGILEIHWVEVY